MIWMGLVDLIALLSISVFQNYQPWYPSGANLGWGLGALCQSIKNHLHCHKILLLEKIIQILWWNAALLSWESGLNSTTNSLKIKIYWQRKMHDLLVSNLLRCPQCNAADGYLSFDMKKLVIYFVTNKGTKRDRKGIKTVGKEWSFICNIICLSIWFSSFSFSINIHMLKWIFICPCCTSGMFGIMDSFLQLFGCSSYIKCSNCEQVKPCN